MDGLNGRVLRSDLPKHALPQRVTVGHGVALVRHAHLRQAGCLRVCERVRDDPVHAFVGVDLFLKRDLIVGPGFESTAHVDVHTLGIFPEHDEVHVRRAAILERA